MPELTTRPLELLITAINRPALQYSHTTEWAIGQLRTISPYVNTTLTQEGVLTARVPANTDIQTVRETLGYHFTVAVNSTLQY